MLSIHRTCRPALLVLSVWMASCGGAPEPDESSRAEPSSGSETPEAAGPAAAPSILSTAEGAETIEADSLPQGGRPTSTRSFSSAKNAGWGVFEDHAVTFYCGCDYSRPDPDRAGVPDHDSCGYVASGSQSARATRVEWEHVVPASRMGRGRACWTQEDCVRPSTGTALRGRACCEATDEEFAMMHSDLHNLVPAVGQVNAIRSDHPYGEVAGEDRRFGECDFEDGGGVAEPPANVRNDIARVYLYMRDVYGLELSAEEAERFSSWQQADPPDDWERSWNRRVGEIQGNLNPLVGP